jgi:hypothetical protein
MPDEDPPEAGGSATQPLGDPGVNRLSSVEILERAGAEPKPLNLNAEHQRRFNEAVVRQQETKAEQAGDDRALRKKFAIWIAAAVGIQIVAADVVFVVYGAANAWTIPGSTISAWLGATVVQVIAVAVVIVRSLFPPPAQSG